MIFVIYRMFLIRKIAKNGITCSKNNEWLAVIFHKLHQKPLNIVHSRVRFLIISYYMNFVIRYLVLFTIRYLVIHAQIIWIPKSKYSISSSFFEKYFEFYEPFL